MQEDINFEPIQNIQLHICSSPLFTFYNTFYLESLKNYARGIAVTVINHDHPMHKLSDLPFAIVNGTHLVQLPQMLSLVTSVCAQRPIRNLLFKPVFNICEEIVSVGRILSEEPQNPYYLFLSPLKKYQMHQKNSQFHKLFHEKYQYVDSQTEQLNNQHFLYKLNVLSDYLSKLDKSSLVIFCVLALMKSLKIDNKKLYDTAAKNEIMIQIENEGYRLVQQGSKGGIGDVRYIGTLPQDNQQDNLKAEMKPLRQTVFFNQKLEFLSRMLIPIAGYILFWRVFKTHSIPLSE